MTPEHRLTFVWDDDDDRASAEWTSGNKLATFINGETQCNPRIALDIRRDLEVGLAAGRFPFESDFEGFTLTFADPDHVALDFYYDDLPEQHVLTADLFQALDDLVAFVRAHRESEPEVGGAPTQ